MAGNISCSSGTEIKTESRCQDAHNWAFSLGLNPSRPLQVGHWADVPYQCSAQVGFDDSLHFNTDSGTDNARFTTGEFVMICERGAGKQIIVVILYPFHFQQHSYNMHYENF